MRLPRSRPRGALIGTALAGLLVAGALSGCAPGTTSTSTDGESGDGSSSVEVDVDTPELRAAKEAAGVEDCAEGTAEATDDGLPSLTLACLGGGTSVDLATLEGPLVINLWASWCGPCRSEMAYFQELHTTYADQVAVIGIDVDDTDPAAALDLVAETGVTYPLLADPGFEVASEEPFTVARQAIPVTVMVDAAGEVVYAQAIAFDSAEELIAAVEDNLGLTS